MIEQVLIKTELSYLQGLVPNNWQARAKHGCKLSGAKRCSKQTAAASEAKNGDDKTTNEVRLLSFVFEMS